MQDNYFPKKEWETQDPSVLGMNPVILSNVDSMIRAKYTNLDGILVLRKGHIVYEKYYHRKNEDSRHNLASVTKSVISALTGIAIDKGFIKSVDEKVIDFFLEYNFDTNDKTKSNITIRHLLTMTAPFPFKNWHEPLDRMRRQSDWVQYALEILG